MSEHNWMYVKFVNGETIFADVAISLPGVTLRYPFSIRIEKDEMGPMILFVPWLPTSSSEAKDVTVDASHILFKVPLMNDVVGMFDKHGPSLYNKKSKGRDKENPLSNKSEMELALDVLNGFNMKKDSNDQE